jgi:hypothetical protein
MPAAVLATLRDLADEIIVAVDRAASAEGREGVSAVADHVIVYPDAEPVERSTPWLFNQANCDWVFSVDDDEIPSLELLDAMPALIADESIVHCWFQIRWLYPDTATYLQEWPWQPHYAPRLVRRDPRLIRFSIELHRSLLTAGPGRFVDFPIWHADALLRSRDDRLAKAAAYERERPGMRIAGRAFNHVFYVPELCSELALAPVPGEEREHIEAVLQAGPQAGPPRATVSAASRERIVAYWPVADRQAQAGRLELLDRPSTLSASEARTVDVRVHNSGSAAWSWGEDAVPDIRVGSRWYDATGAELRELEIHTSLTAPLAPGEDSLLPAHIRAPELPGRYRIEIDLIQQHVSWFDVAVDCEVDVLPRRWIAVIGDDDAIADVAGVFAAIPEVEIVRLRRTPSLGPEGYREASDHRAYLLDRAPVGGMGFAATLLWRRIRLRLGPTPARAAETLAALRGAELLVLAGPDGPDERRERFARDALVRTARSLRVPVAETRDPEDLARLLAASD